MTTNGHFSYFYWRMLSEVLEECGDTSGIELVPLDKLSNYLALKLLTIPPFKKEEYNMDLSKGQWSKEEVLYQCEINNPELWERFMEQIELERIALDGLIQKFGWMPKTKTI